MEIKNLGKLLLKKRVIIPIIVAAALGAYGYSYVQSHKVTYMTKELSRCTITDVVEASGTINPVNTVSVGSTVSGLMKEIYVDYNSEVKKGQFLAQIDPALAVGGIFFQLLTG